MAFGILTIAIVLAAFVFLALIAKRTVDKKKRYKSIKLEIIVSIILIMVILLALFVFPGNEKQSNSNQNNPIQSNNSIQNSKPIKINAHFLAQQLSEPKQCNENYCFNAKITRVFEGNLKNNQVIEIKTNSIPSTFGEIEVFGEQIDSTIIASIENIITIFPVEE